MVKNEEILAVIDENNLFAIKYKDELPELDFNFTENVNNICD